MPASKKKRPPTRNSRASKPRARNREDTKERLLKAAIEIFSKDGYDAATTRKVAKVAGVNESLIHRYYKNKAGLLLAVLEAYAEEEKKRLDDTPLQETLLKDLESFFEKEVHYCEHNQDFIRVAVSRAIVDPKIGRLMRDHSLKSHMPMMVRRLESWRSQGKIRKDVDLDAVAFLLNAMCFELGFIGEGVFKLERSEITRMTKQIIEVIGAGLSAKTKALDPRA